MTNTILPSKKGAPKKTGFYHIRKKLGLTVEKAASILGCSVQDVQRFELEGCKMAENFLRLWNKKQPGYRAWDKWYFTRGDVLVYHGSRHDIRRFTPDSLLYLYSTIHEKYSLLQENQLLRSEVARLKPFDPDVRIQVVSSIRGIL